MLRMPTMEKTVMALKVSMAAVVALVAAVVALVVAVTALMGARLAMMTRPATMARLTVPTHLKHANCAIEMS